MPDGTNTDPLPPDQQIQMQISLGKVKEWLGGLFGQDWDTSAGGGGTGGQFVFASIAELDGVIAQWKDQREAIQADGAKIRQAANYITAYEAKYGKGSRTTFGGHAYDAYLLIAQAVPEAMKKAKPGTKEFRAALRDALENSNVTGTHGVFVMGPQEHNGLDNRARVMIKIDNGQWVLAK